MLTRLYLHMKIEANMKSRRVCIKTRVVYHLHGQTGRFTVWANGKQISVLGNSVRDWRLPFAEIPPILKKNLHEGDD